MTQWNIELTLSTVSSISSQATTHLLISASPLTYPSLCRLVEIVIKRHRKRLDGHFHILITALQSLLRLLLSRPPPPSNQPEKPNPQTSPLLLWQHHARLFSRLLTLICEPTVASVSRQTRHGGAGGGSGGGALDSEKDRAKRYAGQYMYLVAMAYVRAQLECGSAVPHAVREALETAGMYAVLDITTGDGLRIMNDAMDGGGRVVFRELYRRYQRFGKWSGV
jgi:nucleolar pre-ribosomal-associated protein 2